MYCCWGVFAVKGVMGGASVNHGHWVAMARAALQPGVLLLWLLLLRPTLMRVLLSPPALPTQRSSRRMSSQSAGSWESLRR